VLTIFLNEKGEADFASDCKKVPIVKVIVCREVERRFWMGLK
jgi:hypothetical protein